MCTIELYQNIALEVNLVNLFFNSNIITFSHFCTFLHLLMISNKLYLLKSLLLYKLSFFKFTNQMSDVKRKLLLHRMIALNVIWSKRQEPKIFLSIIKQSYSGWRVHNGIIRGNTVEQTMNYTKDRLLVQIVIWNLITLYGKTPIICLHHEYIIDQLVEVYWTFKAEMSMYEYL